MSTGIMIIGPSGSGKTTLGKIVAQKLGYLYFDVDDYIWKQNTDSPYTQMYTREAVRMLVAGFILYILLCFLAGQWCGWKQSKSD